MKKLLLNAIVLFFSSCAFAQSTLSVEEQLELEQVYWNYRDRFKKEYIQIGTGTGQGLPASHRLVDYCYAGGNGVNLKFGDCCLIYKK